MREGRATNEGICSETEWHGKDCEELTRFETESIAKDVHGEGMAVQRNDKT